MRPILEKIIDPIQSAFVPKRSIHDSILLTHEIMNKFRNMKGKKAWVALKLDKEKAYDRVEWDFLFTALHKLGLHSKWIELIKACISTVSYSVIVNDNVCGFFSPTRGIQQEDPLSPYLFIFCMEVLTRTLYKAIVTQKCGIGVKISPKASKIQCLLFAHDSLLFCRTNLKSCHGLSFVLSNFFIILGSSLISINRRLYFRVMHPPMTSKLCPPFLILHTKIILASILDAQYFRVDQKQKPFQN